MSKKLSRRRPALAILGLPEPAERSPLETIIASIYAAPADKEPIDVITEAVATMQEEALPPEGIGQALFSWAITRARQLPREEFQAQRPRLERLIDCVAALGEDGLTKNFMWEQVKSTSMTAHIIRTRNPKP